MKPGPKGPTDDLIRAVVDMKSRTPTWGCPQIAEQVNLAFGTSINKDVVRRILAVYYKPEPRSDGPSWLTFLGHTKDSLVSKNRIDQEVSLRSLRLCTTLTIVSMRPMVQHIGQPFIR